MTELYDVAIVGMGFAGYTGAIYTARYGLKTVIIGEIFGGQTIEAHLIGNYPGFDEITGIDLMQRVQIQTQKLGVTEMYEKVEKVTKEADSTFSVVFHNGTVIKARNVLLTIGMNRKKLDIPGEKELFGKGVTYCATCDGFFFKGKEVAVVGGGDSAVTSALFLAELSPTVHLLVRSDRLRAEQYWVDKLKANPSIKIHFNTKPISLVGTDSLEKIILEGDQKELAVAGVFIEIGHQPNTVFTDALGIKTDEEGFILVDKDQQTTLAGLYAAGDSTNASNRFAQLLTAASEAAIAAEAISRNLTK